MYAVQFHTCTFIGFGSATAQLYLSAWLDQITIFL